MTRAAFCAVVGCLCFAVPSVAQVPADYVLRGDLPEIEKKGALRILIPAQGEQLHRVGNPNASEQALAARFAVKLGLKPVFIEIHDRDQLFKELEEGRADLVAASLSITPERAQKVAFTRPVRTVKQQLVVKASDHSITSEADLAGKHVTVRGSSAYAETLKQLQGKVKGLVIDAPKPGDDVYALIQAVARGEIPYTVADNDILKDALSFEPGVRAALDLTDKDPIGWAMRKGASDKLKTAADGFLVESALTSFQDDEYKADLEQIKKTGVLRVLTRNTSTSYFIYRGEQLGFEYELMRDFAKSEDLRLEMVVPPDHATLSTWLASGRGDVGAAGLTITDERKKTFDFSSPYEHVSELLVVGPGDKTTKSLADLKGRKIAVRKSSSYFQTLSALKAKNGFEFELVPEELETEEILDGVAAGKYAATVADSNIVEVELSCAAKIRSVGPLAAPRDVGWMVRKDQPQLKAALDAYVKKNYQGLFYNMTINKYFKSPRLMAESSSVQRSDVDGKISDWDAIAKKYGKAYEFDWRLVLAQMYQESHFDPKAKSWVGALGLMQVMPATAKDLKLTDVVDPDEGVHAGVMLLQRYSKMFEGPEVKEKDQIRFALAAYNCGPGHVIDGRRLAQDMKLDPNKWFKNVEKAMLELMKPEVAKHARHGYFRATETVNYVSEIQTRYDSYSRLVDLE